MTVRSNPRLILFGAVVVGMPLLGVALFCFLKGIIGLAAVLGAGFFTYQLITFMLPSLRVRIETSSDEIRCIRPGNDDIAFEWSEVTHAGLVHQKSHKPSLFLYSEAHDRFVEISKEFSDFDHLLATVKEQTPFQEIRLDKADSIQDWLRRELHITPNDAGDVNASNNESDTPETQPTP
jgi:hypothetical protein